MLVWILEPKEGADKFWAGYSPNDRIAVAAPNETEARKVAGESQPMLGRQKAPGRRDLDVPNIAPWCNPEASTCREISEESDACVLAVQGPDMPIKDPRVMA
jgi:hypothetical protein